MSGPNRTRRLERLLAGPMFVASMVVLGLFAVLLHLHDVPNGGQIVRTCLIGLAILYPLFWVETATWFVLGSPRARVNFWYCLFPFLRIGSRDQDTGTQIWLPWSGWRIINRNYERALARGFSIPMIVVALLVLPVIGIELLWVDFVNNNAGWKLSLQIAAAFIWAAFTFEFTILISVVKYPWTHVRRHWIDAAIILLPMVTFIRAARLAQLVRAKQIARAARIYRLRGLGMRMWRALVALEIVDMLLSRNPERRLEKLELQLEEKLEEVEYLRRDIQRLQKRIETSRTESEAGGNKPLGEPSSDKGPVMGPVSRTTATESAQP